jgi:hypothetical protein
MDTGRQWHFVTDMNHDGVTTISDISLWMKWLYFYPGDWLLQALMKALPDLTTFLEVSKESYGGFLSGLISFFAWIFILSMLAGITVAVVETTKDGIDFARRRRNIVIFALTVSVLFEASFAVLRKDTGIDTPWVLELLVLGFVLTIAFGFRWLALWFWRQVIARPSLPI